jgi:hypothetical protein
MVSVDAGGLAYLFTEPPPGPLRTRARSSPISPISVAATTGPIPPVPARGRVVSRDRPGAGHQSVRSNPEGPVPLAANRRLRHVIDWWMFIAAREDSWSKTIYDAGRARGQGKYWVLRGLGPTGSGSCGVAGPNTPATTLRASRA